MVWKVSSNSKTKEKEKKEEGEEERQLHIHRKEKKRTHRKKRGREKKVSKEERQKEVGRGGESEISFQNFKKNRVRRENASSKEGRSERRYVEKTSRTSRRPEGEKRNANPLEPAPKKSLTPSWWGGGKRSGLSAMRANPLGKQEEEKKNMEGPLCALHVQRGRGTGGQGQTETQES